jgi:hypothetical protein
MVIGFITGAASGDAAAHALRATWPDAGMMFGLIGALGGGATGLVAADD